MAAWAVGVPAGRRGPRGREAAGRGPGAHPDLSARQAGGSARRLRRTAVDVRELNSAIRATVSGGRRAATCSAMPHSVSPGSTT